MSDDEICYHKKQAVISNFHTKEKLMRICSLCNDILELYKNVKESKMKCDWCSSVKNKELYQLINEHSEICKKCFKSLPQIIKHYAVSHSFPKTIPKFDIDKWYKYLVGLKYGLFTKQYDKQDLDKIKEEINEVLMKYDLPVFIDSLSIQYMDKPILKID